MSYPLPIQLSIIILDTDEANASVLKALIETKPDIEKVKIVSDIKSAERALRDEDFNSLIIDIFPFGVDISLNFVQRVRDEYPVVPICLFSLLDSLRKMPGVNEYWKKRLSHYFKLAKNLPVDTLATTIDEVLIALAGYLQAEIALRKISNFRTRITKESTTGLTPEEKREFEETAVAAEKAIESRQVTEKFLNIVPGVNTSQMEQLVSNTLKEAVDSLRLTTKINIGILLVGSLLVLASFVIASITNRWEAVAFGGFGIAGIIASLITNPLKSISASASRLVQVQVAYLQFLSQLGMLNQDSDVISNLERSKRLSDAMEQTLKVLGEQFGK